MSTPTTEGPGARRTVLFVSAGAGVRAAVAVASFAVADDPGVRAFCAAVPDRSGAGGVTPFDDDLMAAAGALRLRPRGPLPPAVTPAATADVDLVVVLEAGITSADLPAGALVEVWPIDDPVARGVQGTDRARAVVDSIVGWVEGLTFDWSSD